VSTATTSKAKGAASAAPAAVPHIPDYFGDHEDVLVDWLTVTNRSREFLEQFLVGPVYPAEPVQGYRQGEQDVFGAILTWDGINGRNPRLDLSGKALDRRRHERLDAGYRLLAGLLEGGSKVTRLDFAKDSTSPCTPRYLAKAFREKRVVTDYRENRVLERLDDQDLTVYAGSPHGDSQLKVYNKAADLENCPFPRLTRYEFRFRGSTAHGMATQLAAIPEEPDPETGNPAWPVLEIFNALLSEKIRVTDERPDRKNKNYSRAEDHHLWEAFVLRKLPRVRSLVAKVEDPWKRLESHLDWLVNAATGSLRRLRALSGWKAVRQLIQLGKGRTPPAAWGIADLDREKTRQLIRDKLGMHGKAPGGDDPCS
jgi:hypothetical protein